MTQTQASNKNKTTYLTCRVPVRMKQDFEEKLFIDGISTSDFLISCSIAYLGINGITMSFIKKDTVDLKSDEIKIKISNGLKSKLVKKLKENELNQTDFIVSCIIGYLES